MSGPTEQLERIEPEVRAGGSMILRQVLSVAEVVEAVEKVRQIARQVMQVGVHYGQVAGGVKPSLWAPGAEILGRAFNLSAEVVELEALSSGPDVFHYRARVEIRTVQGRLLVGTGIGEASTREERYAWRKAVCTEEYQATPESDRRLKYKAQRGGGHYTIEQVRTNPADLANTVAKMAEKRAKVDGMKFATAASEVFSQDLESLPPGLDGLDSNGAGNGVAQPKPKSAAAKTGNGDHPVDVEAGRRLAGEIPEEAWEEIRSVIAKFPGDEHIISEGKVGAILAKARSNGWSYTATRSAVAAYVDGVTLEALPWQTFDKLAAIFESYKPTTGGGS